MGREFVLSYFFLANRLLSFFFLSNLLISFFPFFSLDGEAVIFFLMFRAPHPSIKLMMNIFFLFQAVEMSFFSSRWLSCVFFPTRVAVYFFFCFCPSPPPQIINGPSLGQPFSLCTLHIYRISCHALR